MDVLEKLARWRGTPLSSGNWCGSGSIYAPDFHSVAAVLPKTQSLSSWLAHPPYGRPESVDVTLAPGRGKAGAPRRTVRPERRDGYLDQRRGRHRRVTGLSVWSLRLVSQFGLPGRPATPGWRRRWRGRRGTRVAAIAGPPACFRPIARSAKFRGLTPSAPG